jgi:hypothetical protein
MKTFCWTRCEFTLKIQTLYFLKVLIMSISRLHSVLFSALFVTASSSALAAPLSVKQASAVIAPFYDALNAAPGKDAGALILKATSPSFVSCGGNDECAPRDAVVGGISGLGKLIPDLRWEIKEVTVSGDKVIVRGEASGTPVGAFLGIPPTGKSFKVMSIDVHTIANGKIVKVHHIEDWATAMRQLTAK